MGIGIPVAAFDVGALPEIVGHDEVLVPSGDAHALADKVVESLDDRRLRLRLGAANRERAELTFSMGKMVAEYRTLYEELLGSGERSKSGQRAPAGGGRG